MAIIACLYGLIAHGSLWYPVNLLAAAVCLLSAAGLAELNIFHMAGFPCRAFQSRHYLVTRRPALCRDTANDAVALYRLLGELPGASFVDGPDRLDVAAGQPGAERKDRVGWFIFSQIAFGLIAGYVVRHSKMVETAQVGRWQHVPE